MIKLKRDPDQQFQISPRVAIRPGDLVRFTSGGPTWIDLAGEERRTPLRGIWRVDVVWLRGRRVYLEVTEIQDGMAGASRFVFVHGRAHRTRLFPSILWRPYKVRKAKR